MTKGWTKCESCRDKMDRERFEKLPSKPYDGSPVVPFHGDRYFWDEDDLYDYLEAHDGHPDDVMLVFAELRKPKWDRCVSEILGDDRFGMGHDRDRQSDCGMGRRERTRRVLAEQGASRQRVASRGVGAGMKRPRKRINPMSAARRAENKIRGAVLAEVLFRDGYGCKGRELVPEVPCFDRLTGHELLSRGRGGSITNPKNIIICCIGHQNWIHAHPEEAHRRGLLKHAWEAPELARPNDQTDTNQDAAEIAAMDETF